MIRNVSQPRYFEAARRRHPHAQAASEFYFRTKKTLPSVFVPLGNRTSADHSHTTTDGNQESDIFGASRFALSSPSFVWRVMHDRIFFSLQHASREIKIFSESFFIISVQSAKINAACCR